MFHGIFTPLVTPVDSDQRPDLESLGKLVRFQLANGVGGLWALGTSGEFAAFDSRERADALRAVVEATDGQVPVIANVSDAATRLAISHAQKAAEAGVQAIAATPPYYYPHSQDELLDHYRAIHQAIDLPLFIYNIPQTVRVRVELETAKTLAREGTVAGIKDSQNDLEWFRSLALYARSQRLDFTLFCGTRHLIDAGVLAGAQGAIPSIANAFPRLAVDIYEAASAGDFKRAAQLQAEIVEIESAVTTVRGGSRNAAVLGFLKAVLHRQGIIGGSGLTQPLRPLREEDFARILAALPPDTLVHIDEQK